MTSPRSGDVRREAAIWSAAAHAAALSSGPLRKLAESGGTGRRTPDSLREGRELAAFALQAPAQCPSYLRTVLAILLGNDDGTYTARTSPSSSARGDGSFASAIYKAVGTTPWGIASGDFRNNSRVDLAIANYGSGSMSVLLDRCTNPKRRAVNH